MKKLILALALTMASNVQAAVLMEGQSTQCKELYNAKAEAMATSVVCEIKGTRAAKVSAQIKAAQCPELSQRDIDIIVSVNVDMTYGSLNASPWFCDTPWAKKAIGY